MVGLIILDTNICMEGQETCNVDLSIDLTIRSSQMLMPYISTPLLVTLVSCT